jgi:hypothetical protein
MNAREESNREKMLGCSKRSHIQASKIIYCVFALGLWLTMSGVQCRHYPNAANGSNSDIQFAIDSARSGDVVLVPAGDYQWSANVTIPDHKKITLKGAGIDATIIRNTGSTALKLNIGHSGSIISGFTFYDIYINAGLGEPRIHHNKFYSTTGKQGSGVAFTSANFSEYDAPQGLVDNNQFYNCRVVVLAGRTLMANTQWTLPLNLGSKDHAVYVEDNKFYRVYPHAGNAIDSNYGAGYVFRYNSIYGTGAYQNLMAHSIQGNNRAARRWEIYGNLNHTEVSTYNIPYFLRGGSGVVLYNKTTGLWKKNKIGLDNVRSASAKGSGGICNGTASWDGNQDAQGYPCRDQIGRGPDSVLWVASPAGPYTQALMPAYGFVNRDENNVEVSFHVRNEASAKHIKQNRDYYDYNASFDGKSGVGCGTLANRPSTCTTGVAYWGTNQSCTNLEGMVGVHPETPISGTLYKCTATNTWSAYFTPYTYPHPLRISQPPNSK